MNQRIGIDLDGCLADFNEAAICRIIRITGRDRFPPRPFDIPCWDYLEQHYGYTTQEISALWASITTDVSFWQNLSPYDGTAEILQRCGALASGGADVYFITSRPGIRAKQQTECWLRHHGYSVNPTVLISSEKGLCAKALDLSCYIDDRDVNVVDVARTRGGKTTVFLLNRPWNKDFLSEPYGIIRTNSLLTMLD
jgi:hypothetical protein